MSIVLDASALLALLNNESGAERVQMSLDDNAVIGAVNLAETVSVLRDKSIASSDVQNIVEALGIPVVPFDASLAYLSGEIRAVTRDYGLSLGDRACLAIGLRDDHDVLTADRAWSQVANVLDVRIVQIR